MDLKNTKEALTSAKDITVCIRKVMKDGKVNVADLPALMELIKKADELSAGVKDIKEVGAEMKDISVAEAQELIVFVSALAKEIREA